MKLIQLSSTDPRINLATEEYIFKQLKIDEDIFILWQNQESVIVGRNQNVFQEVNFPFARANSIPIVRRISGGGTVYHDLGNLNYSWITNQYQSLVSNYQKMTEPIVQILNAMGVPASFYGKSDIRVGEHKISGNAQYFYQNRMLHHGTILFDANLANASNVLHPRNRVEQSSAIVSNRSSIQNIKFYFPPKTTIETFVQKFITHLPTVMKEEIEELTISNATIEEAKNTYLEKYCLWDWNIGESPNSTIVRSFQEHNLFIGLQKGKIKTIKMENSLLVPNVLSSIVGLSYDYTVLDQHWKKHHLEKSIALSVIID